MFEIERPPQKLLRKLYDIPTASLADALDRTGIRGFMSHRIKPVLEGVKMVGPAITVWDTVAVGRGGVEMTLEAMDNACPGDIIVKGVSIDASDISIWGGLMATSAKARGLGGAVVDGGVRDLKEIREMKFQIFSKSIVPSTSVGRLVTVKVNTPIVCGGVIVHPGDVIVGDDDGVVVIPKEKLEEIIEEALRIDEIERKEAEELKKGKSIVETIRKYTRV